MILGGDIFFEYRFLFPCSVLLTALAGKGIATLLSRATALPHRELAYAVVLLSGTLMYTTVWLPIQDYRTNAGEFQVDKRWQIRAVALGLAVKENTAPDAVVALCLGWDTPATTANERSSTCWERPIVTLPALNLHRIVTSDTARRTSTT